MHSTGDRDSLAFICLSRKPVGASASSKTQEITKNIKNQRAFENNIRSFRGNHDLHLQFLLPLPLPMFVLYASYLSIHCMGWFPINWINQLDDELLTNLYISEKCERRNSPNFRDVPGRALFRHGLTDDPLRCWLRQATVMSWRLGPSQTPERRRGSSIWISRWVVGWISIDGLFSCSKTIDSAVRRRSPDFQFLGIIYIYFMGNMSSFNLTFDFMVRNGWVGNSLRSTIFLENSRCDVNFHQLETPKIQECFFDFVVLDHLMCCKNSWNFGSFLIWRN